MSAPIHTPYPSDLAERISKAAQLAQPIFAAHDWKWGRRGSDDYAVPTVERIADTIKRLYDVASTNDCGSCSSGRLSVYTDEDDGSIAVDVHLADLRDEVPGWEGAQREAEIASWT